MHARCGLVHKVNGLIRQEAVIYIPHGELIGRRQRPVAYAYAVVLLQSAPQTVQHFQSLLSVRLGHVHGLETPLQRRVLLNVAAVFLRRRRADYLHLTAAKRGLEDVRGVDRALGAARADDGVQLVDEKDNVARALDVLQHGLHALLKIPAVLRPGQHRRDVQRHYALARKLRRCFAARHLHGKPLRHGRLAHARLADEHGIVLRAP